MPTLVLKPRRDRSLLRHHPWIFSGAVAQVTGAPAPGDTLEVRSSEGRWLARAAYSPASQITGRVWTFLESEAVEPGLFRTRMRHAFRRRAPLAEGGRIDALRLVYAENDGLPGVVLDRYGAFLVLQLLSAGAERRREQILQAAREAWEEAFPEQPLTGIWERSDAGVRRKEGLDLRAGSAWGEPPPELLEVREDRSRYLVDVRRGHKTGFYLDQRENRRVVAGEARGREVLNVFAYTGGFGIAALHGGATRVANLESSPEALALADRNRSLNGWGEEVWENRPGDAFRVLRELQEEGRDFDLVVLDPPKFAESRGQVEGASRGYKDINLQAFRLLRPGGLLFTFSCSGHMDPDLFQKIVADAALDAGRHAVILRWLNQAPDHPTALNFPEGRYLKGLVCRVY
jgi:23S rRNA (cytosine1962-C5)-methyltransferase